MPPHSIIAGAIALAATLGCRGVQAATESTNRETGIPMVTPSFSSSGSQSSLDQAVAADDAAGIATALAAGANVDARAPHGVTPLMAAVDRQKLRSVAALLRAGADPNATAEDGASPVSLAVENYRIQPNGQQIMKAVFQAGGKPDTRRPNGDPVLMKFINLHDCDGVRLMKSLGADLDAHDRGGDPVITKAAVGMDWDVVWCLIELGARFDYENGGARQPLSRSLANKAPSRSSPLFAYKEKVWQRLRDAGIAVPPLPN
jgi:hypothetical protein